MHKIIILLLSSLWSSSVLGQVEFHPTVEERQEQELSEHTAALIQKGLQNVAVTALGSTLYVTFENRRFRDEIEALKEAIDIFSKQRSGRYEIIEYTLQNRGVPTVTSTFSPTKKGKREGTYSGNLQLLSSHLANYKSWQERFTDKLENNNSGNWRIEFEVAPQLLLALGAERDPILHQVNLLPAANMYLWRGAKLRFQGIVPILDELKNPADQFWRPRLMTFSQYIPLPKQFIIGGTVGYFTNRRYGAVVEVNKFLGKRSQILLQARIGFTGFASFPKVIGVEDPVKGWQIGDLRYWTYHLAAEYVIPRWSLRTRLEWRKVLLNQEVIRAEVWRQFNEIQLGFFLYRFSDEENYGFQLALPLFPRRYAKPKRIHFKTNRYFNYTYHTTQSYAIDFSTEEDIWLFYETLHPALFHNRFYQN